MQSHKSNTQCYYRNWLNNANLDFDVFFSQKTKKKPILK